MGWEPRWAFGLADLLHVASLVMRARVWAEMLRELPEDAVAARESRRAVGALVHHADQHGWTELGAAAGAMVRLLNSPLDSAALGGLRLLALRLERVANRGAGTVRRP
jgi:hypothetical protein